MSTLIQRLIGVLVLASVIWWPSPASPQEGPQNLNRVEFQTIDGSTLRLEDLRGKVVLVDFWATWCAPCLADIPRLKKLHATYSGDLVIIGVSLDRLERRTFRSWLRRNRIEWPQVQEDRGYNGDLARAFAVDELPATALFDRAGSLVARDLRGEALESAIRKLRVQ